MYKIKIANVMGLDISNSQHGILIMDTLSDIKDPEDFISYLRSNRNSISYVNRIEKLDALSELYKQSDRNISERDRSALGKFCRTLTGKIEESLQTLRDHGDLLDGHLERLKVEGKQYFTDKELEILKEIGGITSIINSLQAHSLKEDLYRITTAKTLGLALKPSIGYAGTDLKIKSLRKF